MTDKPQTEEFFDWIRSPEGGNCAEIKEIGDGMFAAIRPLLFHWSMIVGGIGDRENYIDNWCYATKEKAEAGLRDWNGEGEPTGWHRHPRTGRRRENGDPLKEYTAA